MSQFTAFLVSYKFIPAVMAPLAAIVILLVEQRTLKIYALGFQYTMVAWLVAAPLPLQSAAAKLITGLISAFIFYWGAVRGAPDERLNGSSVSLPRGRVFRITAVLLVVIGTLGVSFEDLMPIETLGPFIQQAAMLLLVLGILGVGLFINPLQVGISLVTIISGFEIIYSVIEPSLAIVALLALVHLGIALTISYFVMIQSEKDGEVLAER